jgi:methylenetetrahydrofolate dehydrogenase (NADP+) / methenyltetrahydrofolate cyclohydrolase
MSNPSGSGSGSGSATDPTALPYDRTPGGAVLMDGLRLRDETIVRLRSTIDAAGNPHVCLATVLVGDDKPSRAYINSKQKKAVEAGIVSKHTDLPASASQAQINDTIAALAADPQVHGILCQFPLPDGRDMEQVLELIPAVKDVDGLTERSMGRLLRGQDGHVGCTPLGVMRLLERYGVATSGKKAVVIGRSTLTGLPQVLLLGRKGIDATVTLAHSRTKPADLIEVCRNADIIVACAGQARMITADHVKAGAAVVDVGISRTEAGLVGDVDFAAVQAVAGFITPMPGGTGPMTIACLMENTLSAARMQGAFPAA